MTTEHMKIFETESQLHFLHYDSNPTVLGLRAFAIVPEQSTESLYKTVDIQHLDLYDYRKIRAANVIANRVANETRRAIANILFVPDTETEMYYLHCNLHWCKQIVVDHTMQPNELRVTYWVIKTGRHQITSEQVPMAVDGGIQFSPLGFSRQPNAEAYFQRCFL